MKVKYYDIVLENCESYRFESSGLDVYLEGLGLHYFGTESYKVAKHAMVCIEKQAKAIALDEDSRPWQERIDRDITQIHIFYDNGESETYHLDWDMEYSDYENAYETDIDEPFRKIYIISKTKKSLDDF